MVEGGPELVELLLGDPLAVPGQDLVLHLVNRPEQIADFSYGISWIFCSEFCAKNLHFHMYVKGYIFV